MDEAGWHARRRAEKEQRQQAAQGYAGYSAPVPWTEDDAAFDPAEEQRRRQHYLNQQTHQQVNIPDASGESGYQVPGYRPPPTVPYNDIPGATRPSGAFEGAPASSPGPSQPPPPVPGRRYMSPHLQIMCGPMLRYDTVVDNVWHGYCMIVTSDEGSTYNPAPTILLEWDSSTTPLEQAFQQKLSMSGATPTAHGSHRITSYAQKIYEYRSLSGPQSFWRFKFEVPLGLAEQQIFYSLNGGPEIGFWIPGIGQNMRWVAHSCNGFSAGVDTAAFNGADPLWNDLLKSHHHQPIHVLVGGGDQIYCDPLAREPEMASWIGAADAKEKIAHPMTPDMMMALDRFLFNHYCTWFRGGAFGRAISRIPMVNVCDDHDIIDGFGSYPDDLMRSPVFSTIGSRGFFWYLLFQCFVVDAVDGTAPGAGSHPNKSMIIGGEGAYIPIPNHTILTYLGPKVYICLLDCRSERRKDQVCSPVTYERVFAAFRRLPPEVDHLVMLLGVPIVYPRMTIVENMLDSKLNPLTILGKTGSFGLGGFVNKFNSEAELLDDLNDHWCASAHKPERNWFVKELQKLGLDCRLRVTFLSGDVHCAAAGKLYTRHGKIEPAQDPKYMLQIISSAIVNTPPPPAVLKLVATLGKKEHKTLHDAHTDEAMIELFKEDTDGSKLKLSTVLGRRNYAIVEWRPNGELNFDFRVEVTQGAGTTKGYSLPAPPPAW